MSSLSFLTFSALFSLCLIRGHSIVPARAANRDREKPSNSEALRLVYCGAFNSCMKYSRIVSFNYREIRIGQLDWNNGMVLF
ncbi:hypothetical protein BDV38DRAFT_15529 [Aspergillus pseudotamarii]|uniref:Secreted protein n=1 Tax=Aspergillus pseudotamarii TaxID=132259 RepID=A0A5N6SC64_ASPPS|nr:uncharacterized protein BDV38DRAFT_15529 [Aspergillus pseudotamarii]KAE8131557.1 hypothetical protein BDV38DRAFT_15529 [Aspergillus pseudotamarii]